MLLATVGKSMAGYGQTPWEVHGKLQVSTNGHYIEHEDKTPFLWIGDTGWALFHLNQENVLYYLDDRKSRGFTVIQAVAFWYPHGGGLSDGPHNPLNALGYRPFTGSADSPNTSEPFTDGQREMNRPDDYWDHADFIVNEVRKRGMFLALLPCWGSAYIQGRKKGTHVEFDELEARIYGKFLGNRYKDEPHIIWVLGGDIDPENHGVGDQKAVYRAMAEGIGQGVTKNANLRWDVTHNDWDKLLMTFHAVQTPPQEQGGSSSKWFHKDPWLDCNMMETWAWTHRIYPLIQADYHLNNPVKPTIMGEGAYEYGKYQQDCGWVTPLRTRRQAYHTFFAGAAGHTYGAHAIWSFRGTDCGITWKTGLQLPGSRQVGEILKNFLVSQEWWQWVPDQSLLKDEGKGETRMAAVKVSQGDKILVYFPENIEGSIILNALNDSSEVSVTWFDPGSGNIQPTGNHSLPPVASFQPPRQWEDAVLILEKSKKNK